MQPGILNYENLSTCHVLFMVRFGSVLFGSNGNEHIRPFHGSGAPRPLLGSSSLPIPTDQVGSDLAIYYAYASVRPEPRQVQNPRIRIDSDGTEQKRTEPYENLTVLSKIILGWLVQTYFHCSEPRRRKYSVSRIGIADCMQNSYGSARLFG